MRENTPFGPIWLFPDSLPERAAMHGARLELLWPDLEGFSAMHTGPAKGGAWVVRAPIAALEKCGLKTDSAAEHPVKDGTVWPPIHIPTPTRLIAPAVTPEQLYRQDKRRRKWDDQEIGVILYLSMLGRSVEGAWYAATNPPEKATEERLRVGEAVIAGALLL